MTVFVETRRGMLVALHAITSVSRERTAENKLDVRTIYYQNEDGAQESDEVFAHDFERSLQRASPMVPALPGTYRVIWCFDPETNEDLLHQDPVIAWRVDEFGVANPVLCEMAGSDEFAALLFPDGQVVDPDCRSWPNTEAFKKTMREQYEKLKQTAA